MGIVDFGRERVWYNGISARERIMLIFVCPPVARDLYWCNFRVQQLYNPGVRSMQMEFARSRCIGLEKFEKFGLQCIVADYVFKCF